MKLNVRFIMGAFFALTIIVSSCNTFKDEITPENYSEVAKNINANWQLSAVSRNGVDITDIIASGNKGKIKNNIIHIK